MFDDDAIICQGCGCAVGHLIGPGEVLDALKIAAIEDLVNGDYPSDVELARIGPSGQLPDDWPWGDYYTFPVFYVCPSCGDLGHVGLAMPWVLPLNDLKPAVDDEP